MFDKLIAGATGMLTQLLTYALVGVTIVAIWGWTLAITRGAKLDTADTRTTHAEQATADCSVANGQILAIQRECAAEAQRVAGENANAVDQAYRAGVEAGQEQEAFDNKLANPKSLEPGCGQILQAQVCPQLMDY